MSNFNRILLLIVLVAGVVRFIGVETGTKCVLVSSIVELANVEDSGHCVSYNDAVTYRENAILNVHGHWFDYRTGDGDDLPTALHAPLFTLILTPLVAAGITSFHSLELTISFLGCLTVAAVGLLGRRLFSPRIGLIAAAIVAVDPMIWINDVVLMPEGLFALVAVGVMYLAYRFHDRPSLGRAAAFGVSIGVATYTRNEALLAIVLMALPLALGATQLRLRDRLGRWATVSLAALLVLAPWFAFNTARFHTPVFTTGSGVTLRLATCDDTFFDPHLLGMRSLDCLPTDSTFDASNASAEVTTDQFNRRQADQYLSDHAGRVPVVILAKLGRFWGVYHPLQTARLDDVIEQRGIGRSDVGIVFTWLLAPFALLGAIEMFRRRIPLSPLLAWAGCASVAVAVSEPVFRFQSAADVGVALMAAAGLAFGWDWIGRRRTPASTAAEPSDQEVTAL